MVEHNVVHPVQMLNGMYPNSHFLFKIEKEHTGGSWKIRLKLKEYKWLYLLRQL